jgi:four helix bundle protein
MQEKPTSHTFEVLEITLLAIETLKPTVQRIRERDRDLGEQLRRALSSVALNLGEGASSDGGTRLARFATAAGSNNEARVALRVAQAWGYAEEDTVAAGDALLDRVAAMLYRLRQP